MSDSIRNDISALANGMGCSNASLALEKYAKTVDSKERKGDAKADPLFANVAALGVSPLYRQAYERWKAQIDALPNSKTEVVKTVDRVIVGLGSESVLETAITLNRIYGVPILPGSALKGVARSFYENELEPDNDEDKKKHRETGEELFGWEAKEKADQGKEKEKAKSGCVTFFDAWYVPGPPPDDKPLQPDVITVHHPNYYQNSGAEPPTDFDDPTPVGFISARGSFLLAVQGPSQQWSDLAMDILMKALEHYGVGGKTSSGYGRLVAEGAAQKPGSAAAQPGARPPTPAAPPPDPDVQAVKNTQASLVKGRINSWLQKWQQRQRSDPAKARALAEAIRDKVDEAGGPDILGPDKGNYLKMKTWLESNP